MYYIRGVLAIPFEIIAVASSYVAVALNFGFNEANQYVQYVLSDDEDES